MSCIFVSREVEKWLCLSQMRTHTIAQVKHNTPANVRAATTDSPTAGTLFHKVKFSLVKAFYIVYLVSTNKKGIASTELSRKLGLRQKTCWYFKCKVM